MAFPNLLKRLFDTDGSGVTLRGDIMPYGTENPKEPGTASKGSSDTLSRSDHVHPLQTTVSGNAGTATKLATKRTIDGVNFDGSANITHYAACSTAVATAAKTVTLTNFSLAAGAEITVCFTNGNSAANPTLNVNGTGAKAIRYMGAAVSADSLAAKGVYRLVYDGTYWQLIGSISSAIDGNSLLNNDFNNLTVPGNYFVKTTKGTTKNAPIDATASWWVNVSAYGSGTSKSVMQEARMHSTSASSATAGVAHLTARCCTGSTWGTWQYPYAQFAG